MLPNLIRSTPLTSSPSPDPLEIFSTSLTTLFTNDCEISHGDTDSSLTYSSARFGPIVLRTADVTDEKERGGFAHYLWNAGVAMAEVVGGRSEVVGGRRWWVEEGTWEGSGERVLEVGAGG
jgi:nicotinamide N-methyltransferase